MQSQAIAFIRHARSFEPVKRNILFFMYIHIILSNQYLFITTPHTYISPLGYLTLRVYRATLPYDSIAEMQSQHIELTAKLAIVGLEDVKDDSIVASIKSQMVATLALHGVNGEVTTTTVDERFAITSPDTRTMKASVVTKFLGEHRCGSTTDRNGVAVDKQIQSVLSSARALSTLHEYVAAPTLYTTAVLFFSI